MLSYADQEADRFAWDEVIEPGQQLTLAARSGTPLPHRGTTWARWCSLPRLKILISADALWEHSSGFVPPQAIDPEPLAAQRATFRRLAELDVALVIPGHGPMFTDFSGALKRASDKLEAFAADDMKIVRSVVKGMFIYSMMRGSMPLAELPGYVARIGVHRDYNAQFFRISDEAYADWLLARPYAQASCALIANAARLRFSGIARLARLRSCRRRTTLHFRQVANGSNALFHGDWFAVRAAPGIWSKAITRKSP